jgi:hypothetical protein
MRELIDLLHLMTCNLPHDYSPEGILDRRDGHCYYYLEMNMAECDELPDHILWEDKTEKFKFAMGFSTDTATLDFLRDCIKISHEISKVTEGVMGRRSFIKTINNL